MEKNLEYTPYAGRSSGMEFPGEASREVTSTAVTSSHITGEKASIADDFIKSTGPGYVVRLERQLADRILVGVGATKMACRCELGKDLFWDEENYINCTPPMLNKIDFLLRTASK